MNRIFSLIITALLTSAAVYAQNTIRIQNVRTPVITDRPFNILGKDILLFSNPEDSKRRINMTVKASLDEGNSSHIVFQAIKLTDLIKSER